MPRQPRAILSRVPLALAGDAPAWRSRPTLRSTDPSRRANLLSAEPRPEHLQGAVNVDLERAHRPAGEPRRVGKRQLAHFYQLDRLPLTLRQAGHGTTESGSRIASLLLPIRTGIGKGFIGRGV